MMWENLEEQYEAIRSYLSNFQVAITRRNLENLRAVIFFANVINVLSIVMMFTDRNFRDIRLWHCVPILLSLIYALLVRTMIDNKKPQPTKVRLLALTFYLLLFLDFAVIDVYSTAEKKMMLLPIGLVAFSAVYVDHVWVLIGVEAACIICNIILGVIHPGAGTPGTMLVLAFLFSAVCFFIILSIHAEAGQSAGILKERGSIDLLTGLLNKVSCEETITESLEQRKEGVPAALLLIDFDNFKSVNDKYGHFTGDVALKQFGEILHKNFRNIDVIGRVGGDEFMVLANAPLSEEWLIEHCNTVLYELGTFRSGSAGGFSCSIGIAYTTDRYTFKELYLVADDALYEAKSRGKAQYIFWKARQVPKPGRMTVFLASPDENLRNAIKKTVGEKYLYIEASDATTALNEISLYGEYLESVYLDFDMPGITREQLKAYLASRQLFKKLPVHDIRKEVSAHEKQLKETS